MIAVLFALALAGCQMFTTSHGTSTTTPGGGTSTSDPSSGGGGEAPSGGGDGWVVIPNVVGKSLDEAERLAKQAGLNQDVETTHPIECDNPAPAEGMIKCQAPEPGKRVKNYTMLQVQVFRAQHFEGQLVRDQLKPVKGMKLPAAEAYLRKLGWTGKFHVMAPMQFVNGCAAETICGYDQDAGIAIHEDLSVYMNKKADIALPPPD